MKTMEVEIKNGVQRWPPERCDMPDLSRLDGKHSLTLMLNRMFRRGGPAEPRAFALVMNFVRITDKLVGDYERCRLAFQEFIDTAALAAEFRTAGARA